MAVQVGRSAPAGRLIRQSGSPRPSSPLRRALFGPPRRRRDGDAARRHVVRGRSVVGFVGRAGITVLVAQGGANGVLEVAWVGPQTWGDNSSIWFSRNSTSTGSLVTSSNAPVARRRARRRTCRPVSAAALGRGALVQLEHDAAVVGRAVTTPRPTPCGHSGRSRRGTRSLRRAPLRPLEQQARGVLRPRILGHRRAAAQRGRPRR